MKKTKKNKKARKKKVSQKEKWRNTSSPSKNPFRQSKRVELHTETLPPPSKEEHLLLKEQLIEVGKQNRDEYPRVLKSLEKRLFDWDPLQILSYGALGEMYKEADPTVEDMIDSTPSHIELIQALYLRNKRSDYTNTHNPFDIYAEVRHLTKELFEASSLKNFSKETKQGDPAKAKMYLIKEQTKYIRNPGTHSQMQRINTGVLKRIDDAFEKEYGVPATVLVTLVERVVEYQDIMIKDYKKNLAKVFSCTSIKSMATTYNNIFCPSDDPKGVIEYFRKKDLDVEDAKLFYMGHQSLFLWRNFVISPEQIAILMQEEKEKDICVIAKDTILVFLKRFSLCFGDLKDTQVDHLFLGNPVWHKPFIQLENEHYFCVLTGLIPGFFLNSLEQNYIKGTSLENKFEKAKSLYLEDRVVALFQKKFPGVKLAANSEWRDDKENGENDLLFIQDQVAFIVEMKAGKVSPSGLRGSELRMKTHLNDLIIESSHQANRFEAYLRKYPTIHRFSCKSGENFVDARSIKEFIKIGVTFDFLGIASSNLKDFEASSWNKEKVTLNPTISIHDLEAVLDVLAEPAYILHYFSRRHILEKRFDYLGTELDLLTFYLDSGFHFEKEQEERSNMIYGCRKAISLDLLLHFEDEKEVVFIKQVISLWENILRSMQERKPKGWTVLSTYLLDVPLGIQKDFRHTMDELVKMWRTGACSYPENIPAWMRQISCTWKNYVLVGIMYQAMTIEERQKFCRKTMEIAFSEHDTDQVIVLCFDVDQYRRTKTNNACYFGERGMIIDSSETSRTPW